MYEGHVAQRLVVCQTNQTKPSLKGIHYSQTQFIVYIFQNIVLARVREYVRMILRHRAALKFLTFSHIPRVHRVLVVLICSCTLPRTSAAEYSLSACMIRILVYLQLTFAFGGRGQFHLPEYLVRSLVTTMKAQMHLRLGDQCSGLHAYHLLSPIRYRLDRHSSLWRACYQGECGEIPLQRPHLVDSLMCYCKMRETDRAEGVFLTAFDRNRIRRCDGSLNGSIDVRTLHHVLRKVGCQNLQATPDSVTMRGG